MDNVAVCVSGLIRESHGDKEFLLKNIERNKKLVPYPFFFSQWKEHEIDLPFDYITFESPDIKYHCVEDIQEEHPCPTFNRYKNSKIYSKAGLYDSIKYGINQIIGHYYLVNSIPKKYTTIIRLRYDSYLNSDVNWNKMVLAAQDKNIGMASFNYERTCLKDKIKFNGLDLRKADNLLEKNYLLDHAIIHKRKNLVNVLNLVEQEKLLPNEWGWFQALGPTHINVTNAVTLLRKAYVPDLS